jgi:hypothetical protein
MHVVKNSTHALWVALIPLAAIHAVLFAMILLRTQTTPQMLALPSPDRVLFLYVVQLAIDASLLFVGHLLLRGRAISSRVAYALTGGVMGAISYAIVLRNGLVLTPPDAGSEMTAGVMPAIAGMMCGFLYQQFAGLAPADVWPKFSDEALHASWKFDGPIRVRTSVAATGIAAVMPAALAGILSLTFMTLFVPANLMPAGASPIFFAALPAQIFLMALMATVIPSAILVVCTHHIARALHRTQGWEYAVLGALVAVLCCIALARFSPFTSITVLLALAVICGATMGALYRGLAGIEPVPLPEAVIVTDQNTLVPADHPSRQGHSVVFVD